jgi:hypothetical protein
MHVKTYMYDLFKDLVEPEIVEPEVNVREDSPSPEKSPENQSSAGKKSIRQFMEKPLSSR